MTQFPGSVKNLKTGLEESINTLPCYSSAIEAFGNSKKQNKKKKKKKKKKTKKKNGTMLPFPVIIMYYKDFYP